MKRRKKAKLGENFIQDRGT